MIYLDDLPSEVIWEIAQHLPRKSLSCFSRVCRHFHRSAGQLLLAHIRLDLLDAEQGQEAFECVKSESWRHVKCLELLLSLSDLYGPQREKALCDAIYTWEGLFSLLPLPKRLIVTIDLKNLDVEDLDDYCLKARSQAFFELVTTSFAAPHFEIKPSLELVFLNGNYIPATSTIWLELLESFKDYSHVRLVIEAWEDELTMADQPLQFESAFGQRPSVELHLPASCEAGLQLVGNVQQLQGLQVVVPDHETCGSLWRTVAKHSNTLKELELRQPSIPGDTIHIPVPIQMEVYLPQLLHLNASLSGSCLLEHMTHRLHLPALRSIDLDLRVNLLNHCMAYFITGITCGPECTSADEYKVINLLEQLNASLPTQCRSRMYEICVRGHLLALRCYMGTLATLATKVCLKLNVCCYITHPQDAGEEPNYPFSGSTLMDALPSHCRPAIRSLDIFLSCGIASSTFPSIKIKLVNLTNLSLFVGNPTPAFAHKLVKRLLWSTLDMPGLEMLLIDTGPEDCTPYLHMLSSRLGCWKSLKAIRIVTDLPKEELCWGKDYLRFRGLCEVFGIEFDMQERHDDTSDSESAMSGLGSEPSGIEDWTSAPDVPDSEQEDAAAEEDMQVSVYSDSEGGSDDTKRESTSSESGGESTSDCEASPRCESEGDSKSASDYEEGLYYRQEEPESDEECNCEQVGDSVNFEDKYRDEDVSEEADDELLGAMWENEE
ncbi:hypothetical protein P389DRAFT_166299 [Cystobasidium minutum MCA 4210]|uniref:uncharacterized protein n=1 Tax=Cystobasidium minutum MCA 4210 TaxID=1397322 RepID=UPI0034CEC2BA|eukprot:jgi/Rhomi1/166299/fgenesh1_kg.1_\